MNEPSPHWHVQTDASPLPPDTAACIGAFDGFHLGHQALLERALRRAARSAVVTFEPHPLEVLAPDRAPLRLTTNVQRERVVRALGVDTLVVLSFTPTLAQMSPEAFVQRFLTEGLRPEAVVVGADFRFGAGRGGTAEKLRELLGDIGVDIVEPIGTGERWGEADAKLSSSTIRTAIGNGQVDIAGRMLGRWHAVAGTVTTGAKRGRGLGFPTANLAYGRVCVPKTGIYATFFTVWDQRSPLHGSCWPAATSVGTNPTFTATDPGQRQPPVTIETYVLDRDLGDQLYGLEVEVSFVARLRDEQRFESIDGLVAQMQRDVDLARVVLTEPRKAFTLKPSR